MGATKIQDEDGNLMWAANDFGAYSDMKTSAISQILKTLLEEITIKVDAGDSQAYTKSESDNIFVKKTTYHVDIDNLQDSIGDMQQLDSRFLYGQVVGALNQLMELVKDLDTRVTALERR